MKHCTICKRLLDNEDYPLSIDCGGDCIHCMLSAEQQIGDELTIISLCSGIIDKCITILNQEEVDRRVEATLND